MLGKAAWRPVAAGVRVSAVVLVIVAGTALRAAPPARAQLAIRVVDWAAADARPHIVFDHDSQIAVAYRDAPYGALPSLQLARGSGCATVRTLDHGHAAGAWSAVAIDSLGFPNIVHADANYHVFYTLDGGELFGLHTVDITPPGGAVVPDLALDAQDRPYVVVCPPSADAVPAVMSFNIQTGQWDIEELPGPPVIWMPNEVPPAIRVDSQGRPVVAYVTCPDSTVELVVATRSAAGWSIRIHPLEDVALVGPSAPALALDTMDAPHVALATSVGIQVYRFGLLGVTTQTAVPNTGWPLARHALAIDHANRLRLAHADLANESVNIAMNDVGWFSTPIEVGIADWNHGASVALDASGQWALAYYDSVHEVVKVAGLNLWPTTPGDTNCDGVVDFVDFTTFVHCMSGPDNPIPPPGCNPATFDKADCDRDSDVDLTDFARLQLAGST